MNSRYSPPERPRRMACLSATRAIFCLLAMAVALPASAQTAVKMMPDAAADSMIVSTKWLAAHLNDPRLVIVEVTMNDSARAVTIPGSRGMAYRRMVRVRDSISAELPPLDSLRSLAEDLGISTDSRVVVYAQEAPMATRLLMSLDVLGLRRLSYLDGGLTQWQAEGHPVARGEPPITRGSIVPQAHPEKIVDAAWITARLGKPGLSLIDTRTTGEFNGTGNRSGMPSAGHLEGARQLEWEWMFDEKNPLQVKPRSALRALFAERIRAEDAVVTYCWVGYRASATYFMARALGYDAHLYDGSYQDWQRRKLPTKAGTNP